MPFSRGASRRPFSSLRSVLALALGALFGAAAAYAQHDSRTPLAPVSIPRTLTLIADGQTRVFQTAAPTVGAFLGEQKILLGTLDRCSCPLSQPIKSDLRVRVTRVWVEKVVEKTPIAFATKQRFTSGLRAGAKKIVQAGAPGVRVKVVRSYYKDGVPTRRDKLRESVVAARPQIVATGTRGMLASRGYFAGRRIIEMIATGYDSGVGSNGRWAGRTATGRRAGYGVVAVDPRFIPLGTRLYIDGYGYAVAGDTGGAIKGNRIDLCYDSHRAAMRVGRKRVRVLIL